MRNFSGKAAAHATDAPAELRARGCRCRLPPQLLLKTPAALAQLRHLTALVSRARTTCARLQSTQVWCKLCQLLAALPARPCRRSEAGFLGEAHRLARSGICSSKHTLESKLPGGGMLRDGLVEFGCVRMISRFKLLPTRSSNYCGGD